MNVEAEEKKLRSTVKGGLFGGGFFSRLKRNFKRKTLTVSAILAMAAASTSMQAYAQVEPTIVEKLHNLKYNKEFQSMTVEQQQDTLAHYMTRLAVAIENQIHEMIKGVKYRSAELQIKWLETLARDVKDKEMLEQCKRLEKVLKEAREEQGVTMKNLQDKVVARVHEHSRVPSVEIIDGHKYLVFVDHSRDQSIARNKAHSGLIAYARGTGKIVQGQIQTKVTKEGNLWAAISYAKLD